MKTRAESRPRRADAQRNRLRVLSVAQAVFAAQGGGASMEEIARRAGLGVGTLYRHFPTKDALLEALVREQLSRVLDKARALERTPDPKEALFSLLDRLIGESAVRRHLADALSRSGFDWKRATGTLDVRAVLAPLLQRAQRAKRVRRDVTVDEILALLAGTLVALDRFEPGSPSRGRIVEILKQGICIANG